MDILKYHANHETFINYVLNGLINGKIHSSTCKHYTQSRKQVDILTDVVKKYESTIIYFHGHAIHN